MSPRLATFLVQNPLTSRWLDDIIAVLLSRSNGTAHVRTIGRELSKAHDIDKVEQTITRTINNYCSAADDFERPGKYDLFDRVEPATYRLRSFPNAPATIELVPIEFTEAAMQLTWQVFAGIAARSPKWSDASNEHKLEAFAKNMEKDEWRTIYDGHKELLATPFDLSGFGL